MCIQHTGGRAGQKRGHGSPGHQWERDRRAREKTSEMTVLFQNSECSELALCPGMQKE